MNNNKFYKIKSIFIIVIILLLALILTSCKKKEEVKYDTEEDPLNIGFITNDLSVNPFFIDDNCEKEIASYIFSSFLCTNVNGEVVCGEDYNCVINSMNTYYENENHTKSDSIQDGYYPVYEFTLKEGMKFSDGVEITWDDILFNLYVYLDPAYDGLNTLYTLPIEGLSEYQNQITSLNLNTYKTNGEAIKADYLAQNGKYFGSQRIYSYDEWCDYEEVLNDLMEDYIEKIVIDYKDNDSNLNTQELIINYLNKRSFLANFFEAENETTAYLYKDGYKYNLKQNSNGQYIIINDSGKYNVKNIEELTSEEKELYKDNTHYAVDKLSDEENIYLSNKTAIKLGELDYDDLYEILINLYTSKSGTINYEKIIDTEFYKYTNSSYFFEEVLEEFVKEENEDNASIDSISGISVVKIDGVETLRIKLDDYDDSFLEKLTIYIAPKHYYNSSNEYKNEKNGVKFDDEKFMKYLKSFSTTPVGSGAYKRVIDASSTATTLKLERNEYFETLKGKDSSSNNIKNANIKYINIVCIDKGSELSSLEEGIIDYCNADLSISLATTLTQKYGIALCDGLDYSSIVIDASVITNLYERKAIQSVIDASKIYEYYAENVADLLEYNSCDLYNIYPSTTKVTSEYDETMEKAIEYFKNAGYTYDEETKTLVDAPSYAFFMNTKESNSAFGKVLLNAQSLLESIGISVRIDTVNKRDNATYAIFTMDNMCLFDYDLTYKFVTDKETISEINNIINYLYDNGFDSSLGTVMYNVSSIDVKYNQAMAIDYINSLISELNLTTDETKQKTLYEKILSCYNDLSIEVPLYQAIDLYLYNYEKIDEDSLSSSVSFTYSPVHEIWKVTYSN